MQLKRGASPLARLTAGQSPPPSTGVRASSATRPTMEVVMIALSRRSPSRRRPCWSACCRATRCSPPTSRRTINIDWATYNPVSMVLKEKGLLEKEFAKDGIAHPLGADARLQQGARIPQRRLDRLRLDRGLRRAGRQDQRQSDQVDLRLFAAGMDRAGHPQGHDDQQDRGPQGQARRGDARHRSAHLPGARAASASA